MQVWDVDLNPSSSWANPIDMTQDLFEAEHAWNFADDVLMGDNVAEGSVGPGRGDIPPLPSTFDYPQEDKLDNIDTAIAPGILADTAQTTTTSDAVATMDPRAFYNEPKASSKASSKAEKAHPTSEAQSLRIRTGKYKLPPTLTDANRPPLATYKSPEHSSSSIDKPRAKPVHPSKSTTLPADIAAVITRDRIEEDRPIDLFRHLRYRVIKGEPTPPIFEPNHFQLPLILRALSQFASNKYLRILADEERYLSVFRVWLRQFIADANLWAGSIVFILRILSRMDVPIDYLRDLEIGKLARRLRKRVEELNLPIQDQTNAAFQEFERFCKEVLLPKNRQSPKEPEEKKDEKKRKLEPEAGPAKKPKTASATNTSTDMSFFTAPEPSAVKRPLPSIKKHTAPPQPAKPVNLLEQTLKSLTRPADPMARPVAPVAAASVVPPASFVPRPIKKKNKKGHTVQFVDEAGKPGDLLENIRLFSQEDFEFEAVPWQNETHGASTHQLEAAEGSAMKVQEHLEEEVDWVEPSEYTGVPPMIETTPESLVQELRERGILGSAFDTATTPDETGVRIVQKGPTTGGWYQPVPVPAVAPQASSVSALLGALNPALFGHVPAAAAPVQPAYGYGQYPQQNYEYAQPAPIQNTWGTPAYGANTNGYPAQNGWGQNAEYGGQQHHNSGYRSHDNNGYRGRGRGWGKR